jgi:hypothetical protein
MDEAPAFVLGDADAALDSCVAFVILRDSSGPLDQSVQEEMTMIWTIELSS